MTGVKKEVEKLEHSYIVSKCVEYKMVQLFRKAVWQFLQRLNIELLYDPVIPFLGIKPKINENIRPHKNLYTDVHSSIIQQ